MSLKRDFSSVRVNGVFFSLSLIYASLSYSQFHNGHGYCCKRCCSFMGGGKPQKLKTSCVAGSGKNGNHVEEKPDHIGGSIAYR